MRVVMLVMLNLEIILEMKFLVLQQFKEDIKVMVALKMDLDLTVVAVLIKLMELTLVEVEQGLLEETLQHLLTQVEVAEVDIQMEV